MERNIFVVKWGSKFTSEHVNRVHRMCKRNITEPFNFYCYTEDSSGVDDDINIVALDETLDLKAWWWKLTLFKQNNMSSGINLFFDLDVVIQNNIDHFFDLAQSNKIVLLSPLDQDDTDQNTFADRPDSIYFTQGHYNSSIMIWYNNENQDIFEKFYSLKNVYTNLFHGIDEFLSHEISSIRFVDIGKENYYHRGRRRTEVLEDETIVSKIKIYQDTERFPSGGSLEVYFNKNKPVCIFNSCHEDIFYRGMERYLV